MTAQNATLCVYVCVTDRTTTAAMNKAAFINAALALYSTNK